MFFAGFLGSAKKGDPLISPQLFKVAPVARYQEFSWSLFFDPWISPLIQVSFVNVLMLLALIATSAPDLVLWQLRLRQTPRRIHHKYPKNIEQ